MGGNVRVININGHEVSATKMDLTKVDRSIMRGHILELLHELNRLFDDSYGLPIWKDSHVLDMGQVFNGSGESFFDSSITDAEFKQVKPVVGDVDVIVPECHKHAMWMMLNGLHGKHVGDAVYVGNNRPSYQGKSAQINALFNIMDMNVQIDFEFLPFEDDMTLPTAFSKFSHSSSWRDMQAGIKGVHHKYLLRAITGGASLRRDVQVITRKTGKPQSNPDGVTFNKFSVDRGLRVGAYVPVFDANGHHLQVNSMPAYHEVPVSESDYITDVCLIAQHVFGENLSCYEIEHDMYSFMGIVSLMHKYLTDVQIAATIDRMSDLYWRSGAQGFERDDAAGDMETKMAGWSMLSREFPTQCPDVWLKRHKYYQNYHSTLHTDD